MKKYIFLAIIIVLINSLLFLLGIKYGEAKEREQEEYRITKNIIEEIEVHKTEISNTLNEKMIMASYIDSTTFSYMNKDIPPFNIIDNESLALKIATLLLESKYGVYIYKEQPFKITLKDGIWHIRGDIVDKHKKGGGLLFKVVEI